MLLPRGVPLAEMSSTELTTLAAGIVGSFALPIAVAFGVVRCTEGVRRRERQKRSAAARAAGAGAVEADAAADGRPSWLSRFATYDAAVGDGVLAVDCTHPRAPSLTHHRGGGTPEALRADSSTAICLNAARARHEWLSKPTVTCNHFDMDGLGSLYAALAPDEALKHDALLREAARLGDFRELDLATPLGGAALALNVWVNSAERSLFYRPFRQDRSEADGASRKYAHFLPRLPAALALAEAAAEFATQLVPPGSVLREAGAEWESEMVRVEADAAALADAGAGALRLLPPLGLAVIDAPRPLHYYALFGVTRGLDTVLALYPGNRYELEHKYTGFVRIASRATMPRLDLAPLAAALTAAEDALSPPDEQGALAWVANSVVDSGPMMRLERTAAGKASKATRYEHPYERDIFASRIEPAAFEKAVRGYFGHGLRGAKPRPDWSWADIHAHNSGVDWDAWRATCKLPGVTAAGPAVEEATEAAE
jgi:hypothetical protein